MRDPFQKPDLAGIQRQAQAAQQMQAQQLAQSAPGQQAYKPNPWAYALMGMGGALSGQDFLGAYTSQRLAEQKAQQDFQQWKIKNHIHDPERLPEGAIPKMDLEIGGRPYTQVLSPDERRARKLEKELKDLKVNWEDDKQVSEAYRKMLKKYPEDSVYLARYFRDPRRASPIDQILGVLATDLEKSLGE